METGRPKEIKEKKGLISKSYNIHAEEDDKYEQILIWCNRKNKSMSQLVRDLLFGFYNKVVVKDLKLETAEPKQNA